MFKQYILHAIFTFLFALSLTSTVNATLITQDIISDTDGVIGHISINIDEAEDFGGLGIVSTWSEFEFFGVDMIEQDLDILLFDAVFDLADLSMGLISLNFDLNDTFGAFAWNGYVDVDFGGALDVFDGNDLIYFANDLSFGQASVVPEPTAFILFFTALVGLVVRRKIS